MTEIYKDHLKEHFPCFHFKLHFINFSNSFSEDIENLDNLVTFEEIYSPSIKILPDESFAVLENTNIDLKKTSKNNSKVDYCDKVVYNGTGFKT